MARRTYRKRQTNKLKWIGDLHKLGEYIDPETDRPTLGYPFERKIKYNNIGVTATDKTFAERDVNEVVKKIEIRIDRKIEDNQKDYRIKIRDQIYNIERIYVREDDRVMEMSLSYAN
ncbi:head-tail adaptor protein [Lederbergia sp. NSJ-179]|uniref:head-tail adaptor protein n=1 Tax=Lederbergia sp. NSJ-179 TaxID=2931402 RepID=UPI001FD00CA1|nr:head-tail adaptor protein [Lederbergia sp. NSJ-179]MCJ7840509.1 head-tail adaptor protein [Lederbergia sp. NSJ-179]